MRTMDIRAHITPEGLVAAGKPCENWHDMPPEHCLLSRLGHFALSRG